MRRYFSLSQDKGWTYKKTKISPTTETMTIKVMPMELPSNEHFAAEVVVGTRESVQGADPETIKIRLWRDDKYIISSCLGETSVKLIEDETVLIEMDIKVLTPTLPVTSGAMIDTGRPKKIAPVFKRPYIGQESVNF